MERLEIGLADGLVAFRQVVDLFDVVEERLKIMVHEKKR